MDLDLPGLAERRKMAQLRKDLRCHEAQFGGAGSVAAGNHDDGSPDVGHLAVAGESFREKGPELSGPAVVIGRLPQQTL